MKTVTIPQRRQCVSCGCISTQDLLLEVGAMVPAPEPWWCDSTRCRAHKDAQPEARQRRLVIALSEERRSPGILVRMARKGLAESLLADLFVHMEQGGALVADFPPGFVQAAKQLPKQKQALLVITARRSAPTPPISPEAMETRRGRAETSLPHPDQSTVRT